MPWIGGKFPNWMGDAGYEGAFYNTATSTHSAPNSPLAHHSPQATGFSASNSSSIYGKSGTVTPLSLSCKIIIKY